MSKIDTVKEHYAKRTNAWNVGTMIAAGGMLYAIMAFFVAAEIREHRTSVDSHPVIVSQLKDVSANQVYTQILNMDDRICGDSGNRYYRQEIIRLIAEWEKITGRQFPRELLRCANA